MMEFKTTDADGFEGASQGADMAVVLITRQEVEASNIASTVERLTMLSDAAKYVQHFAGRVAIHVSGYDDDPRPLVLVPECMSFFRAVNVQWKYWLHFLVPDADLIKLIVLLLVDVQVHEVKGGHIGYAVGDSRQLHAVLDELFAAMDQLHARFGVPASEGELTKALVRTALDIDAVG